MPVNKVEYFGETLIDISDSTITPEKVLKGEIGYDKSGTRFVGTAETAAEPVIQPLEVMSNGTYTAPAGVDGYSPVTVNVSGGGGETVQVILTLNELIYDFFWYTEKGELKKTNSSGVYNVDKNSIVFIYQGTYGINISGDISEIYNDGDTKKVFFVFGNSELTVSSSGGSSGGSSDRISDTEALRIITGGAK